MLHMFVSGDHRRQTHRKIFDNRNIHKKFLQFCIPLIIYMTLQVRPDRTHRGFQIPVFHHKDPQGHGIPSSHSPCFFQLFLCHLQSISFQILILLFSCQTKIFFPDHYERIFHPKRQKPRRKWGTGDQYHPQIISFHPFLDSLIISIFQPDIRDCVKIIQHDHRCRDFFTLQIIRRRIQCRDIKIFFFLEKMPNQRSFPHAGNTIQISRKSRLIRHP